MTVIFVPTHIHEDKFGFLVWLLKLFQYAWRQTGNSIKCSTCLTDTNTATGNIKNIKILIITPTFSSSIATTSSPTLSFYRFTLAGSTCFLMKSWGLVLSALLWETVLTDAKMLRFQLWILLQLDLLTLSMLVLSGRLWQARVTDCLMPRNGKSAAKLSKRTAPHPLSDRSWTCKLLLASNFRRVHIVQSLLTTFQPNLP